MTKEEQIVDYIDSLKRSCEDFAKTSQNVVNYLQNLGYTPKEIDNIFLTGHRWPI
jgi:hypothetical protein